MSDTTFITKVILQNYKSIVFCDVNLGPLTFLVGPNGSGKSNFLDALHFVADALRTTLSQAINNRNGFPRIVSRHSNDNWFSIRLELALDTNTTGYYALSIEGQLPSGFVVRDEECIITSKNGTTKAYFKLHNGTFSTSEPVAPAIVSTERLYLVPASSLPAFQPVYEALFNMGFYNFNLAKMRALEQPEQGSLLESDGSNIAAVFSKLANNQRAKDRIRAYLAVILPELKEIEITEIPPLKVLTFRQLVSGTVKDFFLSSLSDGVLRAFGILVALFQGNKGKSSDIKLVGIEEPEIAIHPSTMTVILDSLREGSAYKQVIVTSHSPDLIDDKDFDPNTVLAVIAEDGITKIGRLDEVSLSAIHDHLYTTGELLRLNQLTPALSNLADQGDRR